MPKSIARKALPRLPALALALLLCSGAARAEQEIAPTAESASEPGVETGDERETVNVTAQRRSASLQETNISITALSEGDLIDRGVTNLMDLGDFVPNLTFTPNAQSTGLILTLRGISLIDSTLVSRDSPVALYVDGVYQGITAVNVIRLLDIQRVEVLRGPQGDLYGRNASAGAINIITRKPTGSTRTRITGRFGSRERANGTAQVEFPVFGGGDSDLPPSAGQLSGLLSFGVTHRSAYYNNSFGPPIDEERQLAGRVAFSYVNGRLTNDLTADYAWTDQQFQEPQLTLLDTTQTAAALLDGTAQQISGGAFGVDVRPFLSETRRTHLDLSGATVSGAGLPSDRTRVAGVSNTLVVGIGDWGIVGEPELKSITGFRRLWSDTANDFDGTPFDLISLVRNDEIWQASQEVSLLGTSESAAGRFEWITGYFFYHEEGKTRSRQDIYLEPGTNIPGISVGRTSVQNPLTTNDSHAIYGHVAWIPPWLDDRLKLELGLRGTWERRHISSTSVTQLANGTPPNVGIPPGSSAERSFDAFTPAGRIGYFVLDELNVYASISQGFLSGGFNGRANAIGTGTPGDLDNFYRPERVTAYELGFKLRAIEDRLTFNGAGYFYDYTDLQRTTIVDLSTGAPGADVAPAVINAEQAHIWGIELEARANPIDEITLNAFYGLTRASYLTYVDFVPGGGGATRDFADERAFSNVPEHQLGVGGQLDYPLFSWASFVLRLDYTWQSATVLQNGTNPLAGQAAFGLLHGRVALTDIDLRSGGLLTIAVWGRNLLNEQYKPFGIDWSPNSNGSLPWTVQYFGERRSYGVQLIWDWPG